ncbi:MAG: MFS transporter [Phycisphaeraceae bacterium]|nr:MAG: MFS transporter [Phycisphaeraceae bacterium]
MHARKSDRRLPRTVLLLGWVSFFADVSSEMIYPLIPLFVVGVLGASATTLGGIEGGAAFLVAIVTAWAGWRSDRHRRRVPYVRVGYGLPVLGKSLIALATAWPMVLAGRLTDRLGKGLRGSPRDALMVDATSQDMRGRAFGFHRAMDTGGALVGVLASAALLWWLTGSPQTATDNAPAHAESAGTYRLIFAIAAALGLISLAIAFLVRDTHPKAQPDTLPDAPTTQQSADHSRFPASYWRTVALLLVFSLANSSDAFILLRARDTGLTAWAVVLAYAAYNAIYALVSYPAGVISDRINRWHVVTLGWAVYAITYAGFALTGATAVWPLLTLYGVYMALTDGVGKALVADHAPQGRRGTALGLFSMANGLTMLLASILGGLLWDHAGPKATFGAGAAIATLAVILVLILRPRPANATDPS